MSDAPAGRAALLPWQLGVPAAEALVSCGEETHRIRWSRGKVVLDDHDLSAERALVGLGAERCACLELLGTWQESFAGDRRLVLSGGLPKRRATKLPRELDRAATVARLVQQIRRWARLAQEPGGAREALFRRLLEEFRDAVAASLLPSRQRRSVQRIAVNVRPLEPGADSTLEIEVNRGQVRIVAELSVSWLLQVWAWGLATVDGAVALEVLDSAEDGRRLAATLLRWEETTAIGAGITPSVVTSWVEREPPIVEVADDAEEPTDGDSASTPRPPVAPVAPVTVWRLVDGPPVRPRLWWSIDVRR